MNSLARSDHESALYLQAHELEPHCLRWVAEAMRHASARDAHKMRDALMARMEEVWPQLRKLLDDEDATLRAHAGGAVASMFVHGASHLMEGTVPVLLEMCGEYDQGVQVTSPA